MFAGGKSLPVVALFLVGLTQCASGGKVLVWPGEFSHWINMKAIVEELVQRGHAVTVITHSATPTVRNTNLDKYRIELVQVPFTSREMVELVDEMLRYWTYDSPNDSYLQVFLKFKSIIDRSLEQQYAICRAMFTQVAKLKSEQYDVLLIDPMFMCGELMAEKLDLPFILSLRFSFANTMERQCGQVPAPPSYVPGSSLEYNDHMDFTQRVKNLLFYAFHDSMFKLFTMSSYDDIYSELMGKPTFFCETMGKADIWLIRTYWDFEYPKPFLPNFKYVGGLHCKPAKQLPEEMEEFVQSSGDNGIVVFSLGSMIKNLTKERGNTIASALGQIPQKVLWRYSGERPETLAPNTHVYDWIPQNDLLGHPKTKAFITHGGTNGIYEAIYHGVPLVGLPMFAEQPDNIHHMTSKGAALKLNFNTMETQDLVGAINSVINVPSYKENMMKLSRIHHDQPVKPLDTAVFWIESVMRNKGAKHLRVQAHNLAWYQYHCLDIFALLLAVVALVIFLTLKTCSYCCRKLCVRTGAKKKTQ